MTTKMNSKSGSKLTVLFVDDDKIAHKIIKKHLEDWKFESAYSGEEALDMINRGDFQIVVTDISMPGMNGLELLRKIKRTHPLIQVIIVTASDDIDNLISAFEAGANDFLLKPLKRKEIEIALENTMEKLDRWKKTMKELFLKRHG